MSHSGTARFWYLADCDAPIRGVLQADRDTRDLRRELIGLPIANNWQPPPYKIVGSGTWPDWIGFWMPLLSDSGVAAIGHLLGANCELLPWVVEPLHRYRIVHVLTKIPRECWSCEESSSYGEQISSADIISLRLFEVPPIFTLDGFRGRVFVSDRVARQSVEAGLTGVLFVDPRVRALHVPFIQGRRKVKLSGFIRVEDDL